MTSTTTTTPATPAAPALTRTWLPVAAVAVTLVLWASAFVAIRHLSVDFSPGSMALGRLLVGSLCLTLVALRPWSRRRPALPRPAARDWRTLVVIGVLWYAVYMVALNEGERRIDAGTSSMLIQLSPILIAVLAAIFLGDRFTGRLAVGLTLAFAGVVVIALGSSDGGGGHDVLGVLLCLVSAVGYAVALILQKPLMGRLQAVHVTWLACTIGAVVCLPFVGQLVADVRAAPLSSTLWVAYLGVFPTAIAFTTFAYALRHLSAPRLGVTTYLVPVITIGMGWAFLGETPPALAYVGGALALLGVAATRNRKLAGRG